ncbi:MAG: hypothetical protein ABR990_02150 [Terracidiphilus sp.]|jgi:hypothetical protein
MRVWTIAGWALTAFMALATMHGMAQQEEGPILLPKPKPVAATLQVICDLACNWKLDGEAKGRIEAGGFAKVNVELGQHVVVAVTEDGIDQVKQFSEVKSSGQAVVHLALQPVRDSRLKAEQQARDKAAQEARDKVARDQAEKERLEAERNVLNNQAVVDMVAGGLPQELILAKIRSSKTRFDLSAPALIELNKKGIPAEVVQAMIDPTATPSASAGIKPRPSPAADPNDPASSHAPGIYLATGAGADRKLVPLEGCEFKLKTGGWPKVGMGAVADGPTAEIKAANAQPEFYFYFPEGGSGQNPVSLRTAVSPSDVILLRLTVNKEGRREALIATGSLKWQHSDRDHVPFNFSRVGPSVYKVTLPSPLTSGEFGFISLSNNDVAFYSNLNQYKDSKQTLWLFDFGVPGGQ